MLFEFYGEVQGGQMILSSEQLFIRKNALLGMKDGTLIFERIGAYRPHKTQKQLGAYWGLFTMYVLTAFDERGYDTSYIFKLPNPTGREVTKDLLKEFMYSMCPMFNAEGKRITMSDADCDTAVMAKFFEDCRCFAASQWSIDCPDPDARFRQRVEKEG